MLESGLHFSIPCLFTPSPGSACFGDPPVCIRETRALEGYTAGNFAELGFEPRATCFKATHFQLHGVAPSIWSGVHCAGPPLISCRVEGRLNGTDTHLHGHIFPISVTGILLSITWPRHQAWDSVGRSPASRHPLVRHGRK